MNKKFHKYGLPIIVIVIAIVCYVIKPSYALEDTYTREELQNYIVATALSYQKNSYFSDYGQHLIDSFSSIDGIRTDREALYGTSTYYRSSLRWRDLTTTPENVNTSNFFHIDCSGFAFTVYNNTIGYDMSKYYEQNNASTNRVFLRSNTESKMGYSNTSLDRYRNSNKNSGMGWNAGHLNNVAVLLGDKYQESKGTKYTRGTIKNLLTSTGNVNELVYRYIDMPNESDGGKYNDTLKTKWKNDIQPHLKPGDIITYRVNTGAGHVMIYVGKGNGMFSSNSIIHSVGNDYTSKANVKDNKLKNDNSVTVSIADGSSNDYIVGKISKGNISGLSVFRPLNTVCDGNSCLLSKNSNNNALSETQLLNNKARYLYNNTRIRQSMKISKVYYNNNSSYTSQNILSKFNSINMGDEITYKVTTTRSYDNGTSHKLIVTASIPSNASYISCNNGCSKSGNTLTWTGKTLEKKGDVFSFTFTAKPLTEGTLVFDGFSVKDLDNSEILQLGEMKTNVYPSQNGVNARLLLNSIDQFSKKVSNGTINFVSNQASSSQFAKNISDLSGSVSSFGFIKAIYYDAFAIDLDKIGNTSYLLNTPNIKNVFFNPLAYPSSNTYSKTANVFEKITKNYGYNSDTISYVSSNVKKLTTTQQKIYDMQVPGLYGGAHLKGYGDDSDFRVRYLRSFNIDDDYASDFEIGDIIIYFTSNAGSMGSYLYTGHDSFGPVLYRFSSSGLTKYTDKNLDTYYANTSLSKPSNQILNELFDKDLFIVLRPSRIGATITYDYNHATTTGNANYVAYETYKNLETKHSKTIVINMFNGETASTNNYDLDFDGWYSNQDLTEKISNSSALAYNASHTVYAGWKVPDISTPTKTGYTFGGWYTDKSFSNKLNIKEISQADKNLNIYAKWIPNKYTINYNSNGGVGFMSPSTHTFDKLDRLSDNSFTKENAEFVGWGTSPSDTKATYTNLQEIENLTSEDGKIVNLYAVWGPLSIVKYSVTLSSTNGLIGSSTQSVVKNSDAIFSIGELNGYGNFQVTCTNGQTAKISGTTITVSNINADTICTFVATPIEYNIAYDLNGGSLDENNPTSYSVLSDDIVLNNPTKNYNVNINSNISDITISEDSISGNLKFNGWTGSNGIIPEKNVVITKGSTGKKNYIATYEEKNIILPTIEKDNYNCYFSTTSDGTGKKYLSNEIYTVNSDKNNIELFAICTLIDEKYDITYDLNDGSFVEEYPTTYTSNTDTFQLKTPVKEGYEFVGWTGSNGTVPAKTVSIEKGSNGNKNYIANFIEKEYKMTFDFNDGISDSMIVTALFNKKLPDISDIKPTKTGYTFDGWYTSFSDNEEETTREEKIYDEYGKSDKIYEFSNDIVVYAKWKKNIVVNLPTSIKAKSVNYNTVLLSWDKTNATGYKIYKYNKVTKKYVLIKTIKLNSFQETRLKTGETVNYKIRSYKTVNGETFYSQTSKIIAIKPKLSKTKILKAISIPKNKMYLNWKKVSGATGYKIYKYNKVTKKYFLIGKTKKNYITTKYGLKKKQYGFYLIKSYRLSGGNISYSDNYIVKIIRK